MLDVFTGGKNFRNENSPLDRGCGPKMSSIADYAHTQYYYKGIPYSIIDFFHSAEWKQYIKNGKGEIPFNEGIALMMRLAEKEGFPIDVPLFGGIICGDEDDTSGAAYTAFLNWKKRSRKDEYARIRTMEKFLSKNRCYPYILYPLFNQDYSSKEQAHQLYAVRNVWDIEHVKRPFFMHVFKYSKRLGTHRRVEPDFNVVYKWNRKGMDPLLDVYIEAANAFWEFVVHLEGKVEVVGRRSRKRSGCVSNASDLEYEWVEWMGTQRGEGGLIYRNLIDYHARIISKQRERARFIVFMEFLLLYLRGDTIVDDPAPTKQGKPRELYLKLQRVHE